MSEIIRNIFLSTIILTCASFGCKETSDDVIVSHGMIIGEHIVTSEYVNTKKRYHPIIQYQDLNGQMHIDTTPSSYNYSQQQYFGAMVDVVYHKERPDSLLRNGHKKELTVDDSLEVDGTDTSLDTTSVAYQKWVQKEKDKIKHTSQCYQYMQSVTSFIFQMMKEDDQKEVVLDSNEERLILDERGQLVFAKHKKNGQLKTSVVTRYIDHGKKMKYREIISDDGSICTLGYEDRNYDQVVAGSWLALERKNEFLLTMEYKDGTKEEIRIELPCYFEDCKGII